MRKLTNHSIASNHVNTVRTVAATKAAFQKAYQRPINSVYRRFVEEYLTELHLVTVGSTFAYDPFFALGMVEVFDTFMQGYKPEAEPPHIFDGVCQSLQLKPEVIRQDASKLAEILETSNREAALAAIQLNEDAPDIEGIKGILEKIRNTPSFRYSRTFLLGLYSAFEMVAPPEADRDRRTKLFIELTEKLNFAKERVKKDLDLYRSNIEKLAQAQALLEDMAEAARKKKEEAANPTPPPPPPAPSVTPEASEEGLESTTTPAE